MTLGQAIFHAAREYAAMGMPVFPIVENAKTPATPRGFYDATTDFDQLSKWFDPDAPIIHNIAACPDDFGYFVIDCDGAAGLASFAGMLLAQPELKDAALIVETPNHGRHYWYKGQMKSGAGFAPGIDIRGIG